MLPHPTLQGRFGTDRQKPEFVHGLFDRGASYYDGVVSWGFFRTGGSYRRWAWLRHGLHQGDKLLDVGSGTGLVALEAARILGDAENITCLDPSIGMLTVAKSKLNARFVQGRAEQIPLPDASVSFLTMGYALRHVTSLEQAFSEYHRVLAVGGKVLLLEITKPLNPIAAGMFKFYFGRVYPFLTRLATRSPAAQDLVKYYWESMEASVRPEPILEALRKVGFGSVKQSSQFGLLSEYIAVKEAAGSSV